MSEDGLTGNLGQVPHHVPVSLTELAKIVKDAPEEGGGPLWNKQKAIKTVDTIKSALK